MTPPSVTLPCARRSGPAGVGPRWLRGPGTLALCASREIDGGRCFRAPGTGMARALARCRHLGVLPAAVDVTPMIDSKDDDLVMVVVDLVDDPEGSPPGHP